MSSIADLFINRKSELRLIVSQIRERRPRYLQVVSGSGGIGKTTLLKRVHKDFREEPDYHIVYIDFDTPGSQTLSAVRQVFVAKFSPETRHEYDVHCERAQDEENKDSPSERKRNLIDNDIRKSFAKGLAEVQQDAHWLFIIDTIERIQYTDLFGDFLDLLRLLNNAFILIAGRNNEAIAAELRWAMDDAPEQIGFLDLKPFEPEHSIEYFDEVIGDQIDDLTKRKLHYLAQGKPILMGVASTWLLQRHPIDEASLESWRRFLELPIEAIEKYGQEIQREFEYEILGPLRESNSTLNRAILYMALMVHPFDEAIARYLLGIDEESARELISNLRRLLFVRDDMTLHDEMRRLVLNNVWAYIDSTGSRKKRFLNSLLGLAQERQDTAESERSLHEAEVLHYKLMLDIEDGYGMFIEKFDKLLEDRRIEQCRLMLMTIEGTQHRPNLSEAMLDRIGLRRARLHSRLGQEERVEQECRRLLEKPDIPDDLRMEALSLSAYMLRSSDPAEACRRYEEALRIEQARGDEQSVARLKNYLGMTLRRLGEYERAADILIQSIQGLPQNAPKLRAAAMNNLAYVYRQWMKPSVQGEALRWAQTSHSLREHWGDKVGLAYSKQTLGEIYRDYNDLPKAKNYLEKASQLFAELDMEKEVAQINLALANIARKEHEPQTVDALMEQIIPVFERYNDQEYLSMAHNEYGCELRKRGREKSRTEGKAEEAWEHFTHSEKEFIESLQVAGPYRRADNLADMVLLYHYWLDSLARASSPAPIDPVELRRKAHDAYYEAIEIARLHNLTLPECRALESLGDLYYAEGRYLKAFALYYLPACIVMAPYYSTDLHRSRVVFDRVRQQLLNPAIGDEEIVFIARYLARRWVEEGLHHMAPGFSSDFTWIGDNWSTGVV